MTVEDSHNCKATKGRYNMAYSIWEVGGKFVIPGTRKTASLSPVRIAAKSRQDASKDLAVVLNEKFAKDLRDGATQAEGGARESKRFSDGFALGNLQWADFKVKAMAEVMS